MRISFEIVCLHVSLSVSSFSSCHSVCLQLNLLILIKIPFGSVSVSVSKITGWLYRILQGTWRVSMVTKQNKTKQKKKKWQQMNKSIFFRGCRPILRSGLWLIEILHSEWFPESGRTHFIMLVWSVLGHFQNTRWIPDSQNHNHTESEWHGHVYL